ncbi:MAG TPA: hypothetical protein VN041_07530 [Microbacterium sp.]|nr:hypothetical protein [Microbacterium sp.]
MGTVAPASGTRPAAVAPSGAMVTLRWALLAGMVACGVAVAVTGRWNGVALLQIVFLLAYFATYQNVRAAVARFIGGMDPAPSLSRLDELDGLGRHDHQK